MEVSAWYVDLTNPTANADPESNGDPDLWVHWNRRTSLPVVHEEGEKLAGIQRVLVGARPGVFLGCEQPVSLCRERRIRNAVQWTTADGTFWSVQGFESNDALLEIARSIASET